MDSRLIGQVIGLAAAGVTISSWQWRSQASVLMVLIGGGLLWAASYACLGDTVPALGNLFGVLPTLAYAKEWPIRGRLTVYFALLFGSLVCMHWAVAGGIKSPYEDLPSMAGLGIYFWAITRPSGQFRAVMGVTLVFWFVNNWACGSVGGLGLNVLEGFSMASGFLRSRTVSSS